MENIHEPIYVTFSATTAMALYCLSLLTFTAQASSTGLPWEDPLSRVVDSFTGPVAFGASVLGIVAAGMGLIFGGDLTGIIQTVLIIALAVGIIVFATNLLSSLFGVSGAMII